MNFAKFLRIGLLQNTSSRLLPAFEETEKGLSFTAIGTLDGDFVKMRGTRKRVD